MKTQRNAARYFALRRQLLDTASFARSAGMHGLVKGAQADMSALRVQRRNAQKKEATQCDSI